MMNLNQTDLDVIRDVIKAAVSEAMNNIKAELRAELEKSYTREVLDLKLSNMQGEIDDLKGKVATNSNVLKSIWSSAAGKVVIVAQGALVLYALWQILPH